MCTLYRLLKGCELVVEAIKDTGQIKREQRDLEEQVCVCVYHLLLIAWSV